ncbi:MAG: hypothetical protein NTX00_02930 [Candidatus Parcubacteria bacterium]|nr:hypothetical protein [Candidatus Parcubacteria bacterium]
MQNLTLSPEKENKLREMAAKMLPIIRKIEQRLPEILEKRKAALKKAKARSPSADAW